MKVAVFSTKPYDKTFLTIANGAYGHDLHFFEAHLNAQTAILAKEFPAVCVFVNDRLDAETLTALAKQGTHLIALRSAGFNHVDIATAEALGLAVVRVPAYSPYAVAEHTVALILALNRKVHRAYARVREGNFSLDGLLGFDLYNRTVGVVGTGKIGAIVSRIMHGFGCQIVAYDVMPNPECQALGVTYMDLPDLFALSDIITIHAPLTPETYYLVNADALEQMKSGVMLINTSRGALIDTQAVIAALKTGKVGYLGLDVYEQEADLFFDDLSNTVIQDDIFQRLLTFPNVLITGHQAFFTENALKNIAETTLANISDVEQGRACLHQVRVNQVKA